MKGKKSIYFFALIAFLMLILILPMPSTFSWSHGNPAKTDDTTYEEFGPRASKLQSLMYASEDNVFAALETHQIDVATPPLNDAYYVKYTTPPWNNSIKVLGYGPELGFYLFDLNNNNNQYLGNPPDPANPNPMYPNPMSEIAMRRAVAYLSNRGKYVAYIGAITSSACYTPVPPSLGNYTDTDISPGGALEGLCYLYSPNAANATLQAGGFPVGPSGWRYWDRNHNGVKDAGEDFTLKIMVRVDCQSLDYAGNDICASLLAAGVNCTIRSVTFDGASAQVMDVKNFHIYTGYKSVSSTPDYLADWNWNSYWHPGWPPNFAGCNDASFNTASDGVLYANDQVEAVAQAYSAQVAFAANVLSVPLWSMNGYKAVSRTYVGGTPGEAAYVGDYWTGFVNMPGYGVVNEYTFKNMHPEGHEYGDNMTIRMDMIALERFACNPIYSLCGVYPTDFTGASRSDPIYEPLWAVYPVDFNGASCTGHSLALNFTVGTYDHPVYGNCSKVKVNLRPDAEWSDGKPLTTADVYFTLVELDGILAARGLPPPNWKNNVMDILAFQVLDPYNFEILFDVRSMFVTSWLSRVLILPERIWKPICLTGADPTALHPDANMIGCGPYRLKEYYDYMEILLVANKPYTTVTSPFSGTPVTSIKGYYRYFPLTSYSNATSDYAYKFNMSTSLNSISAHFYNERAGGIRANLTVTITGPNGVSTTYTQTNVTLNPGDHKWNIGGDLLQTYGLWNACSYGEPSEIEWEGWESEGLRATQAGIYPMGVYPVDFTGASRSTQLFWVTIREDITGRTLYDDLNYSAYPYKSELSTPDFTVDVKDVYKCAKAYGSYPGHPKWDSVCDINADYKVDIKDYYAICKKYGWAG